jgi:Trk K+ transport system NAD-binding subunit
MTTTIEKSLARLTIKIDTFERKLDAMTEATAPPSALKNAGVRDASSLFAATASDNVAGAAARLRALHDPSNLETVSHNPFGKPASTVVIDGEFTEMKSGGG